MARSSDVLQIVINGIDNATPSFRKIAAGAAVMGTAVAAAFVAATLEAAKFEKGLAEISTLLDGDVTPAIERMRTELLDMSVEFGQSIDAMTKARYDIISAGFTDAADSSQVLTAASRLAVAGVSDVATAADLLTDALGGLEIGASGAEATADILFQTVRKGKTTLDQLGQGFGKVFGTAKEAGVSLEELAAAMSTATASGVKTREAITGLNALILAIAAPTKEAAEAMEDAGISMDQGFTQAIVDVGNATGDSLAKLRELIPSIEALRVASKIAGNVGLLTANLESMNDATGVVQIGFDAMAETFDFRMKQTSAAFKALKIEIGTQFLPIAKKLFDDILDVAVVMRVLGTEAANGKTHWENYADAIKEKLQPALNLVGGTLGFIKDRLAEMEQGLKDREFEKRVTEMMRSLLALEDTPFIKTGLGSGVPKGLKQLREYARLVVEAQDAAAGRKRGGEKTLFDTVREAVGESGDAIEDWIAGIGEAFAAMRRLAVPAAEIIESGFGSDMAEQVGELQGQFDALGNMINKVGTATVDASSDLDDFMEQLEDLAEITAEDFANLAFSIGDSFGAMMGDVVSSLIGLRDGPIMLGRAIKGMVAGAISDIGRLIARMLVAKALMSLFGGGFANLFFAQGGTVPTAAFGLSVPGGGGEFPAVVLPGSPGLDRTMVAAQGGEMVISRQQVNQTERAMKKVLSSPRPSRRGRGRARVTVDVQANRPFRTEENIQLMDSVTESLERGERHAV